MSKQKRKFDKLIASAENAVLVDKSATPEPGVPAEATPPQSEKVEDAPQEEQAPPSEEAIKHARFNDAIGECLNKHKEKGGMAFDILKAVVSNKMETVIQGRNFSELVNACFSLADVFKLEMDTRWTKDVSEISTAIFGPIQTAPIQQPESVAPAPTAEVSVNGTETIN